MAKLPEGFTLERDSDGDPILIPTLDVVIFSEPGEGWLVQASYMVGRDWESDGDCEAACVDYLNAIGIACPT